MLDTHLGSHQTDTADSALETVVPGVPVSVSQRHSLVLQCKERVIIRYVGCEKGEEDKIDRVKGNSLLT